MASAKTKDSKTVPWYRLPREWLKDGATRYIDFNEQLADRLFEQGRRMAATVEQTPVYPLIEFQQTFSRKAFEYYVKGARLLIERL